jgi:hypothetical protein
VFEDVNAQVRLEWSPVKDSLAADELYLVALAYQHQGQIWVDYAWTQQTNWLVNEHGYLLDLADNGAFTWSLKLIHQTGTQDNGVPEGVDLSQSSEERIFVWRRPGPGGGDDGGGGGYGGY